MHTQFDIVTKRNDLYLEHQARWLFLYNSFVGGEDYRQAGYLTKYQLETEKEYKARCEETPLDNQVQSVISVYNSFLFREKPTRDYGSLENIPELWEFIRDADFDGHSIDAFMKEASTWATVFGHAWIILSKPNIDAITRADELQAGVRPYASLLTPLTVIDWEYTREPNGKYCLNYLKYIEDCNGDIEVIKEWTPDTITTWTVNNNDQSIIGEPTIEPNGLMEIPAVILYSERSLRRGIGTSSIGDIADQQRFIYNALSESAQSIRLDSHPSLVATAGTQVGTGAGSIITIEDNSDPGLKPYVLDFAGASIDAIQLTIDNAVRSIEKMANLGGVRSTQSQAMSGIALETEFQLLNARLSAFANNLALAEEQLWKLFAKYQNQPYDVLIEYPDSFSIRDTQNEINQLQSAASATSNPQVLQAIDKKIMDWLGVEEELEAIPDVPMELNGDIAEQSTEPNSNETE